MQAKVKIKMSGDEARQMAQRMLGPMTGGMMAEPKLGTGERFARLKSALSKRKGVSNPGALAAYIGRKKYGASKMSQMAAKNRGK